MVMRNGKPAIAADFGATAHPEHSQSRFLAIDPGDVHVGLAEFSRRLVSPEDPYVCTWAGEMRPEAFLPWYAEGLAKGRWFEVVVEGWTLFPEAAPIYVGSDMPTSRLIGAIEGLAQYGSWNDLGWFDELTPVVRQSPQIKVPARSMLKRRKLRSIAKVLGVAGDHATDAELHGYKRLSDRNLPWENLTQMEVRLKDRRLSADHAIW